MAFTLLNKKPATTPTIAPHDAALSAWYQHDADIQARAAKAQALASGTAARIQQSADLEARVLAIGEELIVARAEAELGDGTQQRVTQLEQLRSTLDAERRGAADDAAVAKLVAAKHQKALEDLAAEHRTHISQWPRLAVPVVREHLGAMAGEFNAAREAFMAAAVKLYGTALAADEISQSAKLGQFVFPINLWGASRTLTDAVNIVPDLPGYTRINRDFAKEARAVADQVMQDLSR